MKEKRIKIGNEKTNYTITSNGDVYSLDYGRTGKKKKLSPCDNGGYLSVGIYHKGKYHMLYIHRLVATYFIKNKDNKPEVNHKNGNKKDNKVSNLEWSTSKENTDHAIKTGLRKIHTGENATDAKITKKTAIKICKMLEKNKYGTREIADKIGVDFHIISNIKHKKCWLEVSSLYNIDNHNIKSKPIKHTKSKGNKINEDQVHRICAYLQHSILSIDEISERLETSKSTINSILYGNAWINISCKYDFSKRRKR